MKAQIDGGLNLTADGTLGTPPFLCGIVPRNRGVFYLGPWKHLPKVIPT